MSDGEWLGSFAKKYLVCVVPHVDSLMVANVFTGNNNGNSFERFLMVKIPRLFEFEWKVVVHHGISDCTKYNAANLSSNLKS